VPETLVKGDLARDGRVGHRGSIVEWRVKPGQWIEAGATLVDVTTDKVDVEVPAPAAGVVRSLSAEEGATVPVGGMLAEIDTSAAKPEGRTQRRQRRRPASRSRRPPARPRSSPCSTPRTKSSATAKPKPAAPLRTARSGSPNASISISARFTGPARRLILAEDVAKAAVAWPEHARKNGSAAPALPPAAGADAKVSPLKGPPRRSSATWSRA